MAIGTAKSTLPPPVVDPSDADRQGNGRHHASVYGESVERHLRRTQRQVKFVDLCTALMVLVAGAVGFFLIISVIDHWIIGLGFFGRLLALGMLLVGGGWHFATVVLPLITHRINPLYAARSIEQGTPSLKNSLINFLMFRANQSAVHRVVYQAMEQKAASDLASVPVDTAVDRSKMINAGYVLIAVLVAGAAYTILSPKDPFQTMARVALPWQSIARPSRIVIEDIQPGSIEAMQGHFVDVRARLHGAREGKDIVSLIYSTNDGQTVERHVTMQLDENGLTYQAMLPVEAEGLQHDLEYRIESGDAVSETFTITLSPAPSILVDSIEYEFPPYTNRRRETDRRDGNIRAIEGTKVTIVATANNPIRSATITFNPFGVSDSARPPLKLPMDYQGTTARKTFVLALTGDRRTAVYDSYQLSFVTESGTESERPILHQIDVVPDLAPEVEILDPRQNRITIPESGRRKIEVRAVDPDFGLSRLTLRAVTGGTNVLEELLFEDAVGRRGQTIVTYEFVPSRLGLTANDKVTYWAVAEDNRAPINGNQAAANLVRTRNYQIEIIPDPPQKRAPPDQPSTSEEGQRNPLRDPSQPGRKPDDPAGDRPPDENNGTDDPAPDEPTSDPSDSPNEAGIEKDDEESQKNEDGQGGQSGGEASADGDPQEGGGGAGASQEGQPKPGESSSSGGSGGNTPQAGGQPDAADSGQGGDDPPPDQLHDGEVFEKVLRKMQEEQAEGKGRPDPNGNAGENNDSPPPGNNTDNPGSGTPSDKPSGQADDQSKPQGDAAGESQGSDTNSQPFSEDGQPKPNQTESKPGDGAQQPDIKRGAGDQKDGNPGEGGDTNAGSGEQQGKPKPDVPGEPDEREKEPGSGDNGDSGAGQNSKDTEGSGSVESSQDQAVNNRDKPKNRNPDSTEPQDNSDPGSTNSKKQSDSEGGESGDQSGGGKKGPGQGANQAGNDSAGQNNSADDGAGASSEAGDGESSDAAGTKQEAPGKTGSSGNKKGDGASSRKDPNGNRANEGATGSSPEAEPGQENRKPRDKQNGGGGGKRPGENGIPTGGGVESDVRHNSGFDPDAEVGEGDAANLEYSRKATDMVINYLKDLESRQDPKLLDELGWTPEEMQQFVDRWQRLKRGAEDAPGRRELDESLRSLGLRPANTKLRQRRVRNDNQRGLSESGIVSEPPEGYRDLFNAFKKGTARVRGN